MRPFACPVCGQLLFFENSFCLGCRSDLGYLPDERRVTAVRPLGHDPGLVEPVDGWRTYRRCGNQLVARCNWLVPVDDGSALCESCRLTSIRPNDDDVDALDAFADAESAKRRLIDQLHELGLPVIDRSVDPRRGVAFELLSSRRHEVTTGHEAGVITLDLSESDDAHREFVRQQLGEPYRTVLGHLRHEVGHYYWPLIVVDAGRVDRFRELFGDERESYDEAVSAHYGGQGATQWKGTHVSQYATMHPWEDWAETFAHYLHIADGLRTASSFGLHVEDPSRTAGSAGLTADVDIDIASMIQAWLGLTFALNAMSRSIGQHDLYPFVLSPPVVTKLDFVHRCILGRFPDPV